MGGEPGELMPENAICERGAPEHAVASEICQNAQFVNESHQNALAPRFEPPVARFGMLFARYEQMNGERGNER